MDLFTSCFPLCFSITLTHLTWTLSAACVVLPVAVDYHVSDSHSVMTQKKYHFFFFMQQSCLYHRFLRTKSRWKGIKCSSSNIVCGLLLIGECSDVAQVFCIYSLSEKKWCLLLLWYKWPAFSGWEDTTFSSGGWGDLPSSAFKESWFFIRNNYRFHLFSLLYLAPS